MLEINEPINEEARLISSSLDHIWEAQYKSSMCNKVKPYIELSELEASDLQFIEDAQISITPAHYSKKGIKRFIEVNENLVKLLGFYLAEGSSSYRNGIRFAISENNSALIQELTSACYEVFGLNPKLSLNKKRVAELKLVNRAAAQVWHLLFSLIGTRSYTKCIPDIVFNIPPTTTRIIKGEEPIGIGGKNSWGRTGYGGPCPPLGVHRYLFKLYALDTMLSLKEKASKKEIESAMQGHIIAKTELIGLYKRRMY